MRPRAPRVPLRGRRVELRHGVVLAVFVFDEPARSPLSNLIGSSDTAPEDVGRLNVTWHHNWWAENVDQRMPRTRRGQIHVFNNLFTSSGNSYCTNAGNEARLLVENNVYRGVNRPLAPDANGDMLATGNLFFNAAQVVTANGAGFDPPYDYPLAAPEGIEQLIRDQAGPRQ